MLNLIYFLTGCLIMYLIIIIKNYFIRKSNLHEIKKVYNELYDNLINNMVIFNNRIDDLIILNTNLANCGKVEIIIYLNKSDIFILQNDVTLFDSKLIDLDLTNKIRQKIISDYKLDINNTIEINGMIFNKNEYDIRSAELYNKILSDFNNSNPYINDIVNESESQNIKHEYNLNDILDKINKIGYNNLSYYEKEFLKNIKKE
ncbi:MAG: hypothetical protein M0R46_06645 [Candidatus Muirbacterium halophilum]|nr:hypothetical protein [Candidatus Muirbacterium halophilum]